MTWSCAAIDHGVTVYPNGKIGPCCLIAPEYLKSIELLRDSNRFVDLKTDEPPDACRACVRNEYNQQTSYRQFYNNIVTDEPGLQFVDIRNTNLCNLKCRYCGPHYSNKWAEELKQPITLIKQDITEYQDILFTDSLHELYSTGGEPLINHEHWQLLQHLVDKGLAKQINLLYNTNLTTLKYKDLDIINLWKQFKSVNISVSIDAVNESLDYIRSGSNYQQILDNLTKLNNNTQGTIKVTLAPVLSILNIWTIDQLFEYANEHNLPVKLTVLTGPDYLSLDVIPTELKAEALRHLNTIRGDIPTTTFEHIKRLIENNQNEVLFPQTLSHILLLDQMRGEKLFDMLPFKSIAVDKILRNHEYE